MSFRKRFIDAAGNKCILDTYMGGDKTYWEVFGSVVRLHRIDGPAFDWPSADRQEWFLHGNKVDVKTQEEFERYVQLKAFW